MSVELSMSHLPNSYSCVESLFQSVDGLLLYLESISILRVDSEHYVLEYSAGSQEAQAGHSDLVEDFVSPSSCFERSKASREEFLMIIS